MLGQMYAGRASATLAQIEKPLVHVDDAVLRYIIPHAVEKNNWSIGTVMLQILLLFRILEKHLILKFSNNTLYIYRVVVVITLYFG